MPDLGLDRAYETGGMSAVIRVMLTLGNPDADEFALRWKLCFAALQKEHPDFPKSGFVEDRHEEIS
jgi:hypothetical protein